MLPRMKLLPLYGLVLFGLVQFVLAGNTLNQGPPHELIVAPEPEVVQKEDEDLEQDPELKEYGVIFSGLNLCGNIANNSYLPRVGDCASFIDCVDQKAIPGNCYDKYPNYVDEFCEGIKTDCEVGFDYTYQACNNKMYVKCMPKCELHNLTSFCYDRTCTKYVLCYYGYPVLRECLDGLQYNSETDRCDFPEFVDCVENECSQEITPRDIVYIASKASCEKYYICSDGKPYAQECARGLYFNPERKHCDFKPTDFMCKTTAQQRNIKSFSRSPPRRADIVCSEKGVHFYAHKSRRDAYYYCVNGNGVTLDCTPGLFYDSEARECREPQYIK